MRNLLISYHFLQYFRCQSSLTIVSLTLVNFTINKCDSNIQVHAMHDAYPGNLAHRYFFHNKHNYIYENYLCPFFSAILEHGQFT